MTLRSIKLEELTQEVINSENCFVNMDFLYEPVFLELKKLNTDFKKMTIVIDRDSYSNWDVYVSLCRIWGIPERIKRKVNKTSLIYTDFTITLSFKSNFHRFSGFMERESDILYFSSDESIIWADPVIVLPEGDGIFYRNLDKKESEEENRTSMIGNPIELLAIYNTVRSLLNG